MPTLTPTQLLEAIRDALEIGIDVTPGASAQLPAALGATTPVLSLSVVPAMSASLTTGQKAVTNTVGQLAASGGPFRNGIKLTNLSTSASPLFYGASGVTASTGDELPLGTSVVLTMSDPSLIYVITASGTATASYAGLA